MKKEITKTTKTNDSVSSSASNSKFRPKHYRSFGSRVFINAVLFACFLTLCFITASKTIEREKTTPIKYTDVNKINYKVYLKDNDLYKEKYLDMNRAYVASLIDHIDLDFSYLFNMEKITNMDFNYKIMAELIIENKNGAKYVDEEYELKEIKAKELKNGGYINIDDSVTIDYDHYNNLANKFKNKTGVEVTSYLNVYLQVDKKSASNLNYKINESSRSNIKIPLSERAIEINLTTNQGTANKHVIPEGKIVFNPTYLFLEIVLFLITCVFMLKLTKYLVTLIKEKNPYDKYVAKILKDYDRLIVETKTSINMSDCKIIDVTSFNELLDVRDNLKQPIIYNVIAEHQKGMFYIKDNNDVYRYVVKDVDLIKRKK